MFSLEIESDAEGRDILIADLWEQGSCGIAEPDGHCLRAFFEDGADRTALLARYPGAAMRIEEEIGRPEFFDRGVESVIIDQHRAQNAALRFEIVGQSAFESGSRGHGLWVRLIFAHYISGRNHFSPRHANVFLGSQIYFFSVRAL